MTRARISTTVDAELLGSARALQLGTTDSGMIEAALRALLERHRAVQIDASYAVYDDAPLDQVDAWGDLASFREAAART